MNEELKNATASELTHQLAKLDPENPSYVLMDYAINGFATSEMIDDKSDELNGKTKDQEEEMNL